MLHGIINVYKEAGYTSHDVVAKLRGIAGQKKIGHTGTLDPDAVGVLPVCLGKATKVCSILEETDKTYRATLLLGLTTDTEDVSGKTLTRQPVSVKEEEIEEIIMGFLGEYDQIPPMYSAKKINGRKLYELARQGIVVERKACRVHIKDITLEEIDLPRVIFSVTCSKGTYIRSLCRDIGEKAGCGACMESLTRTRVGRFTIDQAVTLSQLQDMKNQAMEEEGREGQEDRNPFSTILIPVDKIFDKLPMAIVDQEGNRLLYNGNPVPAALCSVRENPCSVREPLSSVREDPCSVKETPCRDLPTDQEPFKQITVGEDRSMDEKEKSRDRQIRLYDSAGAFIGIYKKEGDYLKPVKLFFC